MVEEKVSTAFLFLRYRLALGFLALLSLISFFILQENIRSGQSSAAIVNISGRQRMLSQRIALFSLRIVNTQDSQEKEELRKALKEAIDLMEKSHYGLIRGSRSLNLPEKQSDKVRALYFSSPLFLDKAVRAYLDEARALAQESSAGSLPLENPHLQYILEASRGELIKSLDSAVMQYQKESEARIRGLKALHFFILLTTLLALVATGYCIFRPMARRIQIETEGLKKQALELTASNERLQKEISGRKKLEEELVVVNELNATLLKTFPFGIDIVDEQGNILYLNERMKGIFGAEALGKKCYHLYKDNKVQCESCPLKNGIQLGQTKGIEVQGVMEGRTFLISHTGMFYRGKKTILEIFEDITEYKKTQEKLALSERLAGIGRMAGVIAHEFRNQLGVIRNVVYFLKMKIEDKDEKVKRHLVILDEQVSDTERIIENILTFSRTKQPELQKIDLKNLLKAGIDRVHIPEGIEIVTNLEELPVLEADPVQLSRVFVNLILNAVQAIGEKGKIQIKLTKENNYATITFTDTGKGVRQEDALHLFEPFFSTKARGTGLGLATAKIIIEGHGGSINLKSDYGKGASVIIRLPL